MTCRLLGVILEESSPEELQVSEIISFEAVKCDESDIVVFGVETCYSKVVCAGTAVGDHKNMRSLSYGKSSR